MLSFLFGGMALRMLVPRRARVATQARSAASRRCKCLPALHENGCLARFKHTLTAARRAIGVRGSYFELRLLVEEWIELAVQTAVAYSASRAISNVALNVTFAVVIFINSVSSLVYTRVFLHSLLRQRIACVFTDLVLDFVWGTLLPIWMLVPVVKTYTTRATSLSDMSIFSGMTRTMERTLVLSLAAFIISILPLCGSLLKLLDLHRVLCDIKLGTQADTPTTSTTHIGRRRHGRITRVLHVLMPVYGLGVLLTSLAANGVFQVTAKQPNIPCNFRVHPWFSTKEACLRKIINCTALDNAGDAESLNAKLELIDRSSLAELVFTSCTALEMPSRIHQFKRLMMLVVENASVISWNQSAELTGAIFVDLRAVHIFDVEFVKNPVGFIGVDGPVTPTLEWVHLYGVDGNRLLSLVGDRWGHLMDLDCLQCGLTSFPAVMYSIPRLVYFSLALNDIPSIPEDWARSLKLPLQMFWLDVNLRLTELPDSLWQQVTTCGGFSVAYTNLSVVPEWVADIAPPGFQINAVGTPVCTGQVSLSPRLQSLMACS